MRLLLDTHALLWWWKGDAMLSSAAREAIADDSNEVFVSAAVAWEIAVKVRKGTLPEMRNRVRTFERDLEDDSFKPLVTTVGHALKGGALEGPHKDPFARLIAAQGLLEDMIVVTRDQQIAAFGCKVLW